MLGALFSIPPEGAEVLATFLGALIGNLLKRRGASAEEIRAVIREEIRPVLADMTAIRLRVVALEKEARGSA